MYCIEKRNESRIKFKYIALNERQWVVRLGLNVYPNHVEPGSLVTNASTACTAKQIEELKLGFTRIPSVFAHWFILIEQASKERTRVYIREN